MAWGIVRLPLLPLSVAMLGIVAAGACGTVGFDYLGPDERTSDAAIDTQINFDASIPELGDYTLAPMQEGCLYFFKMTDGDQCQGAPVRREGYVFAVFEFQIPELPQSGVRIDNVAIDLRIDSSDDDNSTTDQGEVHLIPSLADILGGGPAPSDEPILSPELNGFPPKPVPGAGQPSRFSLDAGEYLLREDRVWIALRTRVQPGLLLIEPASTSLSFSVVAGTRPTPPLIDDSRLLSEGIRTVFANFSACRNKSVALFGNECRFGGLKTDTAPDTIVSYLHFVVPDLPAGQVLASAKLRVHSSHTGGAEGAGIVVRRATPFTPTSINIPGSASNPTDLEDLAPRSGLINQFSEVEYSLNTTDLSPGDLYLSLSNKDDAVFLYGHNPPADQLANRPQLILTFAAAAK